jgi:hypothetical protein
MARACCRFRYTVAEQTNNALRLNFRGDIFRTPFAIRDHNVVAAQACCNTKGLFDRANILTNIQAALAFSPHSICTDPVFSDGCLRARFHNPNIENAITEAIYGSRRSWEIPRACSGCHTGVLSRMRRIFANRRTE